MSDHPVRTVGDTSVDAGRGAGQLGWYRFAANLIAGSTVIDIGCGLGRGLDVLKQQARDARGQDLDTRLERSDVMIVPVASIPSKGFDFVTCIDVIEHVEEDVNFMGELARIARKGVFITTPLSIYGRKLWPYHLREYTFAQFVDLTKPLGPCDYFKGSPSGEFVIPVHDVDGFLTFQKFFNYRITNLPVRMLQKLIPVRLRNMAHQAALVKSR